MDTVTATGQTHFVIEQLVLSGRVLKATHWASHDPRPLGRYVRRRSGSSTTEHKDSLP